MSKNYEAEFMFMGDDYKASADVDLISPSYPGDFISPPDRATPPEDAEFEVSPPDIWFWNDAECDWIKVDHPSQALINAAVEEIENQAASDEKNGDWEDK